MKQDRTTGQGLEMEISDGSCNRNFSMHKVRKLDQRDDQQPQARPGENQGSPTTPDDQPCNQGVIGGNQPDKRREIVNHLTQNAALHQFDKSGGFDQGNDAVDQKHAGEPESKEPIQGFSLERT
jgi:hypothetical protein